MGLVDALFLLGLAVVMLYLVSRTPRRSRFGGGWWADYNGAADASSYDCGAGFDGGGGGGGDGGGC